MNTPPTIAEAAARVADAWRHTPPDTARAIASMSPTLTDTLDDLDRRPTDPDAIDAVEYEWAAHIDYRMRPDLAGHAETLYITHPHLVAALGQLAAATAHAHQDTP